MLTIWGIGGGGGAMNGLNQANPSVKATVYSWVVKQQTMPSPDGAIDVTRDLYPILFRKQISRT